MNDIEKAIKTLGYTSIGYGGIYSNNDSYVKIAIKVNPDMGKYDVEMASVEKPNLKKYN